MLTLSAFPLPLPPDAPPAGYRWDAHELSALSTTTASNSEINKRDVFLGKRRCIVCGVPAPNVQHCHIIIDSQLHIWEDLKERRWILGKAKASPRHEPRNGLSMCPNHRAAFNSYQSFIRYVPEARKFVFINYANNPYEMSYHGKAIALDINDRHAPFPSLFIIHEARVRGHNPFQPPDHTINDIEWQDWINTDGVYDHTTGSFKRQRERQPDNQGTVQGLGQLPFIQPMTNPSGPSSAQIVFDENSINEILAATRASASWKACQIEGTSWTGTADENVQKYLSSIGTEESAENSNVPVSQ